MMSRALLASLLLASTSIGCSSDPVTSAGPVETIDSSTEDAAETLHSALSPVENTG